MRLETQMDGKICSYRNRPAASRSRIQKKFCIVPYRWQANFRADGEPNCLSRRGYTEWLMESTIFHRCSGCHRSGRCRKMLRRSFPVIRIWATKSVLCDYRRSRIQPPTQRQPQASSEVSTRLNFCPNRRGEPMKSSADGSLVIAKVLLWAIYPSRGIRKKRAATIPNTE